MDLILTLFCALTLLVLAFADCGSTSKEEELLDTLLLVARNVLQFARLAAVMRQWVGLSLHRSGWLNCRTGPGSRSLLAQSPLTLPYRTARAAETSTLISKMMKMAMCVRLAVHRWSSTRNGNVSGNALSNNAARLKPERRQKEMTKTSGQQLDRHLPTHVRYPSSFHYWGKLDHVMPFRDWARVKADGDFAGRHSQRQLSHRSPPVSFDHTPTDGLFGWTVVII